MALSRPMQRMLSKVTANWEEMPCGITNATLCALIGRGLVEKRPDQNASEELQLARFQLGVGMRYQWKLKEPS